MRCYGCFEELNNDLNVCPYCGYVVGTKAEEAIFMEPGTRLRDRYTIGRTIGFGGFGVTYIAWDDVFAQKVAIKEYLPGEFSTRVPGQSQVKVFNGEKTQQFHDGMKQFVDEAKRLAKFQNENGIVKIFDSFEKNNTAYIVMEYLEGWTLTEFIKSNGVINEDTAVEMLMPVMESLKKVHEVGLLHRDIAPDNIFLTKEGEVKLIDFGAARFATTSHSRSLTVIIKPGFSPEEQYRSRGDQGSHTDVYALAATLYKMMTGQTPPDALERRAMYETKSRDLLDSPRRLNKNISRVREVALLNALNVRIEDRTPDIDSFLKELSAETPVKRRYGKLKKIDIYRWPKWVKGSVAAAFAVVLLFGGLLATGVIHFDSVFASTVEVPEGMVIVPYVEGMKSDKAIRKIEKAGLVATTAGNIESEYVEAGKIVLQSPDGERFAEVGSKVGLTISSGKPEVNEVVDEQSDEITMPYVIWDAKDTAIEKLKAAGFPDPEIEEAYDAVVANGQVISASIEAGKVVKRGTKVKLIVSKGEEPKEETTVAEANNAYANQEPVETEGTDGTVIIEQPQESYYEENPSANTEGSSGTPEATASNAHQHNWVDVTETVHHPAETHVEHHDGDPGLDWQSPDGQMVKVWATSEIGHCSRCGMSVNHKFASVYFKDDRLPSRTDNAFSDSLYRTLVFHDGKLDDWGQMTVYENWTPIYSLAGRFSSITARHLEDHGVDDQGNSASWVMDEYESGRWEEYLDYDVGGHLSLVFPNAYDETIVDKEAWDETIVTGQKCSVCGAIR